MLGSKRRRRSWQVHFWYVLVLVLGSCAEQSGPSVSGSTHWVVCERRLDCAHLPGEAICVEGYCEDGHGKRYVYSAKHDAALDVASDAEVRDASVVDEVVAPRAETGTSNDMALRDAEAPGMQTTEVRADAAQTNGLESSSEGTGTATTSTTQVSFSETSSGEMNSTDITSETQGDTDAGPLEAGPAPVPALSCGEMQDSADVLFRDALAQADRSCSSHNDCVLHRGDLSCVDVYPWACQDKTALSVTGENAVLSTLDFAEQTYCIPLNDEPMNCDLGGQFAIICVQEVGEHARCVDGECVVRECFGPASRAHDAPSGELDGCECDEDEDQDICAADIPFECVDGTWMVGESASCESPPCEEMFETMMACKMKYKACWQEGEEYCGIEPV